MDQPQITVSDPIIKDSGFSKFTTYNIKGQDQAGAFDTYRRYSDFFELREALVRKWPGCYIPPIPEKQLAGGNDMEIVQQRKRLLNIFLQILTHMPYIFNSDDVQQIFLRSSSDVSKIYSAQRTPTTQEIIERYKQAFPDLEIRDQQNAEYMLTISTFQGQLRKSQMHLKGLIEQAALCASARKQLQDGKNALLSSLLPSYEQQCLSEYVNQQATKLIFANSQCSGDIQRQVEQLSIHSAEGNPSENIPDLFRYELKDSEAMQQCLAYRDFLISQKTKAEQRMREDQVELANITAGKQTITTITNSVFNKSKDQAQVKVEQKIQEGQQEIDRLGELINIVTALVAQREISFYRGNRVRFYHRMLQKTRDQEARLVEEENQLLSGLNYLAKQHFESLEK